MFRKLRNNMLLFNMATVSLVVVLAFSAVYFVTARDAQVETKRRLDAISDPGVMSSMRGGMNSGMGMQMMGERFRFESGPSFLVTLHDGEIARVTSRLDLGADVYQEVIDSLGSRSSGTVSLGGLRWAFQRTVLGDASGPLVEHVAFLDVTDSTRTLNTLVMTLLAVGGVVLAAIFWLSLRFADRAVTPIQESYEQQQRFVADASHELRTPLAVIGANIDAIESSGDETVASQSEWFGYVKSELARTGKLVDDLLYLARSESEVADEVGPFNLSRAAETAGASMEALLHERDIDFSSDVADGVVVSGDGERLAQVVYILLDNAAKYTPEGGTVQLTLARESGSAVLRVANTGNGIAREDLPRIFDRFYRPDDSRTSTTGGTGLGLSIAKAIVGHSGGAIGVESANGSTTFTVRLPLT